MIKLPQKIKYTKMQRHILRIFKLKKKTIYNKELKIISLQKNYLTLAQIILIKTIIRRFFKKKVKILIPLLLNYQKTQKGKCSRMGKGKGKNTDWVISVTYGSVLFEIISFKINFYLNKLFFYKLQSRLPIKVKIKIYETHFEKKTY